MCYCWRIDEARLSFIQLPSDCWVNTTLLRHAYLATTPIQPTFADSLELLDILAAVLRCGASVSIQVMAKAFWLLQPELSCSDSFRV